MRIICFNSIKSHDGVTVYRAVQPLKYLESKGHTIVWMDYDDKDNLAAICKDADILYMATPGGASFPMLAELVKQSLIEQTMLNYGVPKEEMLANGLSIKPLKVVIDFDDDIFEINPHNVAYLFRGRKNVVLRDEFDNISYDKNGPIYLWKNGKEYSMLGGVKKPFDLEKNKENLKAQIEILRLADLFTTPSSVLQKRLKRFVLNGKTYLRPNAIDKTVFINAPKTYDKIRLLWTLSESHYFDWTGLYPSIGKMMKKYPNLELVTVGSKFVSAHRAIPLSRWEHHGWVDMDDYGEFMSGLNCNLGIAHVKVDNFNNKKSPLKWEEYSALGMATIASEFLYGSYIPEGCGVVYSNVAEFEDKLSNICEGKLPLAPIAAAAHQHIMDNYELKVVGDAFEKRLEEMIRA